MGASNGTKVWANPMHGDAKAPICRSAVKRACQYLVGEFFSNPASWTSGYLGRVQAGILGALLLGVCFIAKDPVRRNTFGRSSQKAVLKLSSIKLRHSDMSQDEGVNQLKDEMTNRPVIACIMTISICKGHECNFSQATPCAYK
jgi:hypothetical protein